MSTDTEVESVGELLVCLFVLLVFFIGIPLAALYLIGDFVRGRLVAPAFAWCGRKWHRRIA